MRYKTVVVKAFSQQQQRTRQQQRQRCQTFVTSAGNEVHTPILIVGGGPSGLMLSRLLDSYGTPSTVLEASPSLTTHPQAHFLNTRTMEILRHSLPILYERVQQEMPPVDQWKSFRFGHDMNNVMACVIHPVERPLQANIDANGKLVETSSIYDIDENPVETTPLSVCSVGHLAQHTFCRLLHEAETPLATVEYGMPVVSIDNCEDGLHRVHTKGGITYRAPVVVAADGARSILRKLWNIEMDGQEAIQHLVNVHIRASSNVPPAMLYSIWNPQLVGMMVCHSRGEYVLQIPYFPPYQTIERNFTLTKVRAMVEAAFGGASHDVSIESIRPWTMSSLIARRYVNDKGGVLVGDAAHVFPPAGGFGMNTGLQDVHNLAWRLSLWHKNPSSTKLSSFLSLYEAERRPVAQRNAALSVRNYRRILNLTNACYLNNQHPAALVQLWDQMTMLPLSTRQTMFHSLVETAMWPLNALQNPSNLYAQHVTNNVRHILRQGGGLPLLFPKYELGFGYGDNSCADSEDWTQDSVGYTPQAKVGHLLPHVELAVLNFCKETYPNLQVIQDTETTTVIITSSDLPSQLRVGGPCFALLVLNALDDSLEVVQITLETIKTEFSMDICIVQVVPPNKRPNTTSMYDLVVQDIDSKLSSMVRMEEPVMVLVRPDGHIACIEVIQDHNTKDDCDESERILTCPDGLLQALERIT
jgi:2-polyprenyl-6-methoxyphenol hydroxylase-like FAD-dependent oxidoreductase